jgi:hypothetical protein
MPSLVDIAPPELTAEEIDIRGTKLKVQGISGEGWMTLYARHPVMRALVAGRTEGLSAADTFASQAALIAAGLGQLGDENTERLVMDRLTTEEQRQVVETIVRLSMPGHLFGPLLNGGGADVVAAHSIAEPATK